MVGGPNTRCRTDPLPHDARTLGPGTRATHPEPRVSSPFRTRPLHIQVPHFHLELLFPTSCPPRPHSGTCQHASALHFPAATHLPAAAAFLRPATPTRRPSRPPRRLPRPCTTATAHTLFRRCSQLPRRWWTSTPPAPTRGCGARAFLCMRASPFWWAARMRVARGADQALPRQRVWG